MKMKDTNQDNSLEGASCSAIDDAEDYETLSKNVQEMSHAELIATKEKLVSSIQAVSLHLGQLLQERHYLQEEVAGRHVTIAQLLRVQETRASELGLQPAVQMSPAPRR